MEDLWTSRRFFQNEPNRDQLVSNRYDKMTDMKLFSHALMIDVSKQWTLSRIDFAVC